MLQQCAERVVHVCLSSAFPCVQVTVPRWGEGGVVVAAGEAARVGGGAAAMAGAGAEAAGAATEVSGVVAAEVERRVLPAMRDAVGSTPNK